MDRLRARGPAHARVGARSRHSRHGHLSQTVSCYPEPVTSCSVTVVTGTRTSLLQVIRFLAIPARRALAIGLVVAVAPQAARAQIPVTRADAESATLSAG